MWINIESTTFVNVPVSYSVATTRAPQDITDPKTYRQLSLGADQLYLRARGKGDRPGDDRRIHRCAARAQEGDRPLQRARRRRAVPVAEPVPRHAGAGAQRAGRHAQGARLPVQERPVHQGDVGAAGDRQVGLRTVDLHASRTTTACSTASSPCCWPCSPAGSEASSSAGIEAAMWISTTTRTDAPGDASGSAPRAHARRSPASFHSPRWRSGFTELRPTTPGGKARSSC